jgi:ubiquinone biosynthesis protein
MPLTKMMRNIMRTQEILKVFFRHGFGDLLDRMGLSRFLTAQQDVDMPVEAVDRDLKSSARHFREALQELSGAFIKLGQVLSTRPDVLPKSWILELIPLQDNVPAVEFDVLKITLEEELGPQAGHFQSVDPNPLASASIAQVHRATTNEGDDAVVKIRKPGIKQLILQDCDILQAAAELLERHVPESRNYRPLEVIEHFRRTVLEELDFTREGQNLELFNEYFKESDEVQYPRVYWEHTTECVLTMQRIEGTKISLVEVLRHDGIDPREVARILAEAVLRQALQYGLFHGDPHPGNVMVLSDGSVCFLDVGMVGRLDERTRENLLMLVYAGVYKETQTITDILLEMNALPENLDRVRFQRELNLLLERYYRIPLKRIRIEALVEDLMETIRKFRIQVAPDLLLVGKAVITLEGIGRALDPDFDTVAVAKPIIEDMVHTHYGPSYWVKKAYNGAREVYHLFRELPGDIRELSHNLRNNRFTIVIEHTGLKEPMERIDEASKRISLSMVISSIVIASSVIALASIEPRFLGVPVLGLVGFAIAVGLSIWLVFTTIRPRK